MRPRVGGCALAACVLCGCLQVPASTSLMSADHLSGMHIHASPAEPAHAPSHLELCPCLVALAICPNFSADWLAASWKNHRDMREMLIHVCAQRVVAICPHGGKRGLCLRPWLGLWWMP